MALPKNFFKFFGFHICDRAWIQLRVAPPPAFVVQIVAEKIVSREHLGLVLVESAEFESVPEYGTPFLTNFERTFA